MAFVVLQHLSPDFKSLMDELLSRRTSLRIRQAEDDLPVEANTVYLLPPMKEMIIRGGSNIYPVEVERVLNAQPGVRTAAVVGKPDARLGEIVAAFIEVAPGAPPEAELLEQLKAACNAQLAKYKAPEIWRFTDALPRNAMDKVVKPKLRELL